jgi:glutathione peroxidase
MYKTIISLCAVIALVSCEFNFGPSSRYLTEDKYTLDVNYTDCFNSTDGDSIFKYSIENINSSLPNITFSALKGKILLIINTATYCQSAIEYPQMNKLKEEFGDQLVIVGFPSNNFWNQEPTSSAEEIYNAMKYVRPGNGFVPKFLLTKKIDVNGKNTHPIFSYLKRSCPSTRTRFVAQEYGIYEPKNSRDLKWNFEKFLIDPHTGQPLRRYDTSTFSANLSADIRNLAKLAKL